MIILASASDLLRVVTSSANALDAHVSLVTNSTTAYTPLRVNTAIAAAATTSIAFGPAASQQRHVKYVSLNARGGANTVTVEHFDGATSIRLCSVTLQAGETLEYNDPTGWLVKDATGATKTTGVGAGRLLRAPQVVLATNAAFAHPTGTNMLVVRGVGSGGGGGGCQNVAGACGSGGNSGNWGTKTFTNINGTSNITIGAAGTTGSGVAGGNGGDCTFVHNGVTLNLRGGVGGTILAGAATNVAGVQNAANAASVGEDSGSLGETGNVAMRTTAATTGAKGGQGGSNPYGNGGDGVTFATGNGGAARGRGAGGGGAAAIAATAGTGGAATAGMFIIEEYS